MALESSKLFKNEFGIIHTSIQIDNHYETLVLSRSKFEHYLSKLYYNKCEKKIANAEAITNAIQILATKGIFEYETLHYI